MSEETNEQTGAQSQGQQESVTFTEAQQAKVQELINEAHGKAMRKAEQKLGTQMAELQSQLEAFKSEQGNKKSTFDEEAARKMLADTEAKYQAQIAEMLNGQKTGVLMSAASKANAVNPEVVAKLVGDAVAFEDGRFVVQEGGKAKLNKRLEPMTVDEYVADYLEANPYLKKPSNVGGAGSGGAKLPIAGEAPARPRNFNEAAQMFGQRMNS